MIDAAPSRRPVRPRLCFVNLGAYPALVPGLEDRLVGGEEVQHSLLARMFAAEGYDVSLVTADFGQSDAQRVDGLRVFRSFDPEAGIPILRFVHPRWTGVDAALRRADADLYYVSCAGALVGWVAWFARRRRRRMVFRVASDTDCDPARLLIRYARDRWLYNYGLRGADAVLAQTDHQVGLLRANYGIGADVVPMALEIPDTVTLSRERDIDVLWIANMRALKRPELFLQAARSLPRYRFHMVGGSVQGHSSVFEQIQTLAASVPNLTLHGRLGVQATLGLVGRARLFVSTSLIEGFPNTFLQAWAREVPTVSFFDPDGLVERHGLGRHVSSIDEMTAQIETLLRDPAQLARTAAVCGDFMRRHYARGSVLQPYIAAFDRVMRSGA